MTAVGWLQIALLLAVLTALVAPLGGYLSAVFRGASWGQRRFGRLEHGLVRAIGADPTEEQEWKAYARSIVVFSAAGFLALYVLLRAQAVLPLNPQGFRAGPWDLSFNTAASFVSNTSWQYYGERRPCPTSARWPGSRCSRSSRPPSALRWPSR